VAALVFLLVAVCVGGLLFCFAAGAACGLPFFDFCWGVIRSAIVCDVSWYKLCVCDARSATVVGDIECWEPGAWVIMV